MPSTTNRSKRFKQHCTLDWKRHFVILCVKKKIVKPETTELDHPQCSYLVPFFLSYEHLAWCVSNGCRKSNTYPHRREGTKNVSFLSLFCHVVFTFFSKRRKTIAWQAGGWSQKKDIFLIQVFVSPQSSNQSAIIQIKAAAKKKREREIWNNARTENIIPSLLKSGGGGRKKSPSWKN